MSQPWSNPAAPVLPVETAPPAIELRTAADDDPRLGNLVGRSLDPGRWPAVAVLGFPTDEGVARNGGRLGAREAPDRIRQWFYRLTAGDAPGFAGLLSRLHDFGNLRTDDGLEAAQSRLALGVAACLEHGTLPIVLGGGHETAFGHFLGYVAASRGVAVLNWDAHLDVRPLIAGRGHSGSPFRQILEHASGLCRGYRVAGLQPHAVSAAHLDYLAEHGGEAIFRPAVDHERIAALYRTRFVERRQRERIASGLIRDTARDPGEPDWLVSFDVDSVDQAFAPGVSAPATGGLSVELWLAAAREAGRSPWVRSIDLVELAPPFDRDDQTARLAALTIWTFLTGVARRPEPV